MTLPPLPSQLAAFASTQFLHCALNDLVQAYGQQCREAALEEAIKACDAIGTDQRALYKGRAPYKGTEPGRADPHVDGKSDGAWECEEAIRKLK